MIAVQCVAVSCVRCGASRHDGRLCAGCQTRWVPAGVRGDAAGNLPGQGAGVGIDNEFVRARLGARALAGVVDVVSVALPIGLGGWLGFRVFPSLALPLMGLGLLLAAVVLVVQLGVLVNRGRSLGRKLASLRTVDVLSRRPVRSARLLHQLTTPGLRPALFVTDLRRGPDPLDVRLQSVSLEPAALAPDRAANSGPGVSIDPGPADRSARRSAETGRRVESAASDQAELPDVASGMLTGGILGDWATGTPADRSAVARRLAQRGRFGPYRSAGIVLDSGERYELNRPVLIGRNPVDPDGRTDRALLSWTDLSRQLAKTHLLIERLGPTLTVTDLYSESGTTVVAPDATRQILEPGEPTEVSIGSLLDCGGRTIKVVPGG